MSKKAKSVPLSVVAQKRMATLRRKIDSADQAILKALSVRFKAVDEVGVIKRANQMPLYQKARWAEVVEDRLQKAKAMNVNSEFTKSLLKLIHKEAIRIQKNEKRAKS